MTKLLLIIPVAAAAAVGLAISGWLGESAEWAQARHAAAAPASTVTLTGTTRIGGIPLRMDVALLRRAGRTATLDLRLRNLAARSGGPFAVDDAFSDNYDSDVAGIYLVDPATGRRLSVQRAGDACVCSGTEDVELAPGGATILSASFPAPNARAKTADVVVPHFGAFRDVPLR